MNRLLPIAALAASLALGACGQATAVTTQDSKRVDAAMAKVEAEQARTDRIQARKRKETAARYEASLELPEHQRGITQPPK